MIRFRFRTDGHHLFLPIVFLRQRRYRTRVRVVRGFRFAWLREIFLEGTVHRIWCGPVLIVCMVDFWPFGRKLR